MFTRKASHFGPTLVQVEIDSLTRIAHDFIQKRTSSAASYSSFDQYPQKPTRNLSCHRSPSREPLEPLGARNTQNFQTQRLLVMLGSVLFAAASRSSFPYEVSVEIWHCHGAGDGALPPDVNHPKNGLDVSWFSHPNHCCCWICETWSVHANLLAASGNSKVLLDSVFPTSLK